MRLASPLVLLSKGGCSWCVHFTVPSAVQAAIAIMGSTQSTALGEILEVTRSDKKMEKEMQVQH